MKKTGPVFETIACADVADKTADSKLNIVWFGEKQEGALFDAFHAAAKDLDNYSFFATGAECAADHKVSEAPGAAIFRTFDESPVAYTGAAADDDFLAFLKTNSVETLFEFSEDSVEPIFHEQNPVIILMLDGE